MKRGKALVLHGAMGSRASVDEKDIIVQAQAFLAALCGLGWDAREMAVGLDLCRPKTIEISITLIHNVGQVIHTKE